MRCNGTTGRYASTPDSAAVSVTGDIDLRCQVALDDWTPGASMAFFGKYDAGSQRSYIMFIDSSGKLNLTVSNTGSASLPNNISSVATGVTDGAVKWVRSTRVASTGVVKFYTSDDGTSWTQLGTDISGTSGNIYDGTLPLEVGSYNGGGSYLAKGFFYTAQVLSGIAGTVVFNADFADRAVTFTESSSNAATVSIFPSGYEPTWLPAEALYGNARHYGYEMKKLDAPESVPKTTFPAATGGTTYPVAR
jgi:hypothetical protein